MSFQQINKIKMVDCVKSTKSQGFDIGIFGLLSDEWKFIETRIFLFKIRLQELLDNLRYL